MMRTLKTFTPALVLALLLAGGAAAQTPFALSSIGQPVTSDDARMVGRGGWGMAVHDSINPGFTNVASLTALRHVALRFTAYGEKGNHEDAGNTRTTNRTLIPDIRVGVPVIKGRLALTTGIQVSRTFEYRTLQEATWYAYDDTLTGNSQFLRGGTVWQVPFGVAWSPRKGVSLGATLGLANGSITEEFFNYFIEPSDNSGNPLYLNNGRSQEDEFSGTLSTYSVMLGSGEGFALGASYTPAHDLDVNRKLSMGGLAARTSSEWTLTMPEKWRAGFQVPLGGRWRLGGDGSLQAFGDFTGPEGWTNEMVDEYQAGIGIERVMAYERHGGRDNLPLRLGFNYRRWGYLVGGEEVTEKTLSVGTGFPFRSKMGMLDVALSYSMLGDEAKNGMQSDIWRMTVSVSGLERWW